MGSRRQLLLVAVVVMSYRGHRGGRGGPNRGGGRGRGRPPPGLSGREIGMYYKQKSQQKTQERERKEVHVFSHCSHGHVVDRIVKLLCCGSLMHMA